MIASPSAYSGIFGDGQRSEQEGTSSPTLRRDGTSQGQSQMTAAPKHGSAMED
jgi:hypothetical protein